MTRHFAIMPWLVAVMLCACLVAFPASAQRGSVEGGADGSGAVEAMPTSAQAGGSAEVQADIEALEVPSVLPGSIFYGLKIAWEGVVDLFAIGQAKVERRLERAEERIAEAAAVHAHGNAEAAMRATTRAQAKLEAAAEDLAVEADEAETEVKAELYLRAERAYRMLIELHDRFSAKAEAGTGAGIEASMNALRGIENALDRVRARVEIGGSGEAPGEGEAGSGMEAGTEADAEANVDTGAGTGTIDVEAGAGLGL